jgi:hypothetical protein
LDRQRWLLLVGIVAGLAGCDRGEESERRAAEPAADPPPAAAAPEETPIPRKALAPEISFKAPEAWRALPTSQGGPVAGDFVAREGGPAEQVRVQVQRRAGAVGATPGARVASVETDERAGYAEVERQARQEYAVAGNRVVVLELEGVQKRLAPSAPGATTLAFSETQAQASLVAIVETPGAPYRVFARGPAEGIREVREEFMNLVYSLRLAD